MGVAVKLPDLLVVPVAHCTKVMLPMEVTSLGSFSSVGPPGAEAGGLTSWISMSCLSVSSSAGKSLSRAPGEDGRCIKLIRCKFLKRYISYLNSSLQINKYNNQSEDYFES